MWKVTRSRVFLSVLLANLVPAVGVVVLDWAFSMVLLVYWFEWGVVLLVMALQACRAELLSVFKASSNSESRPGTRYKHLICLRRGTFSIGPLSCYYRNIPDISKITFLGLGVWTVVGVGWLYLDWLTVPNRTVGTLSVAVAVVALAGTQTLTTAVYFIEQQYRDCGPTIVLSTSAAYTLGALAVAIPFLVGTLSMEAVGKLGLLAFVGGKTGAELLVRRRKQATRHINADPFDYDPGRRELLSGTRPVASLPPVSAPDAAPITVLRPDRLTLFVHSPIRGVTDWVFGIHLATLTAFFGVLAAASPVFFELSWPVAVGFFLLAVVLWVVLSTLVGLVHLFGRYGSIEYQFYDDQLVCYDRVLSTAQWSLSYDEIEDWTLNQRFTDRLLSTATIHIEAAGDETTRLVALPEPEITRRLFDEAADPISA